MWLEFCIYLFFQLIKSQQEAVPSSLVLEGLVPSSLTCTYKDPPLACSPGEMQEQLK